MAQGKKANLTKEQLEELMQKYTIVEIAKLLDLNETTVRRYKNQFGLKCNLDLARQRNSEKHTQYQCDIHYFDKIDTLNKAYILGFLCADGYVTSTNQVGVGLSAKDKDFVYFFKQELKSAKDPTFRISNYGTEVVDFFVQNNYLATQIQKYHIIPNKSLVLNIEEVIKSADLTDEQISVFLLGYFDGDGCISIGHNQTTGREYYEMNITGTFETINYFYNYFSQTGSFYQRNPENKTNNYTLQFSNNYSTIYNALSKLYQHKDKLSFYFQRKYQIFNKLKLKVES